MPCVYCMMQSQVTKDIIVELKRQLGLITGILVIVADMIGTGIFMTTGNILG